MSTLLIIILGIIGYLAILALSLCDCDFEDNQSIGKRIFWPITALIYFFFILVFVGKGIRRFAWKGVKGFVDFLKDIPNIIKEEI